MQEQLVSMSKLKFRIGDLAQELKIKKYIIRFWEKEFDLKSDRSDGGQRFYTEDDLALFSKIKQLLYLEGYTIAGARKQLGIIDGVAENIQAENLIKASMFDTVTGATEIIENNASNETIVGACVDNDLLGRQQQFLQNLSSFKEKLLQIKESIEKL